VPSAGLRFAGEAATEFDGLVRESFGVLLAAQREPVAAP
jgi:hypothetical protein